MPKFDDPGLRRGRLSAGPSSPSIQHSTLIAVVEQPLELAGRGTVPGIERESAKKMLHRWCDEVAAAGHAIARICVAYEADAYGCIMVRSPGGSTEYRVAAEAPQGNRLPGLHTRAGVTRHFAARRRRVPLSLRPP